MDLNVIKSLDGQSLTEAKFSNFEESENVIECQNCGISGKDGVSIWWNVKLIDGTEISVYTR